MKTRTKVGIGLGSASLATVVGLMLSPSSTGPCYTPPAGAATDCLLPNGGQTSLNPAVTVPPNDIAQGRLRWGNGYATGQLPTGKCTVSEADNTLPSMWQELHSCTPTWQDGQDMGIILGQDTAIEREYCNQIGPCTPQHAAVITKDNDSTWSTGKATPGHDPRDCPPYKPTEKPCGGPQEAWNCFWSHKVYVVNNAPHCGGSSPPTACVDGPQNLCLLAKRFKVEVNWKDHGGNTGKGQAIVLTTDTGAFWFFQNANYELMVKVLDGRTLNGHYWVFYGALSDVEYTVTVTDETTLATKQYHNAEGTMASVGDTVAFPG